ncbi:hypothetical protein N0V85_008776 [Neurospora sp. IMI 360204]|nr:hypothetical protein N0V85_008776 [Neurospora sp. IMI 360204]
MNLAKLKATEQNKDCVRMLLCQKKVSDINFFVQLNTRKHFHRNNTPLLVNDYDVPRSISQRILYLTLNKESMAGNEEGADAAKLRPYTFEGKSLADGIDEDGDMEEFDSESNSKVRPGPDLRTARALNMPRPHQI